MNSALVVLYAMDEAFGYYGFFNLGGITPVLFVGLKQSLISMLVFVCLLAKIVKSFFFSFFFNSVYLILELISV